MRRRRSENSLSSVARVCRARLSRAIPESVILDTRLSHAAFRALVYLITRGDAEINIFGLMTACGLGEDGWRTARRCLESCGYYLGATRTRATSGHWLWVHEFTDTPEKESTIPGLAGDGAAEDGDPGDKSSECKTSKSSLQATRARAQPPRADVPVEEAEDADTDKRRRSMARPEDYFGVECWSSVRTDRLHVDALVAEYGEGAVRAVAKALRLEAVKPLPSRVAKCLAGAPRATATKLGNNDDKDKSGCADRPWYAVLGIQI